MTPGGQAAADPEGTAAAWLVVGLGNPGPAYAAHRHNVGYLVVEELARRQAAAFRAHRSSRSQIVEGRLGVQGAEGPRVVLAETRAFMNELGGPVKALAGFYKVPPARLVAVHDELDIGFDTLRVKLGGGDGGHNGLRSIRASLGTGDFHRVRVGIGRHRVARTRPTSCSRPTPRPSGRSCRSRSIVPPTPSSR